MLTLKEIRLQDLGKGPEGMTGAELMHKIADKVIQDTAVAVAKAAAAGVAGGMVLRGLLGIPF